MIPRPAILALALAVAAAGSAMLSAQPPAPFTFQANTRLVVETVTVTDAAGRPIAGLTARDFAVTEDGKPQTISFCDYQQIEAAGARAQHGRRPLPALNHDERKNDARRHA